MRLLPVVMGGVARPGRKKMQLHYITARYAYAGRPVLIFGEHFFANGGRWTFIYPTATGVYRRMHLGGIQWRKLI